MQEPRVTISEVDQHRRDLLSMLGAMPLVPAVPGSLGAPAGSERHECSQP
jgi:hypothetical protein